MRRILIVKLSSLGDVVHAMPVIHDMRAAQPGIVIDWLIEPAFAPLIRRVNGIAEVIECPLRRWRKAWWTTEVREEWRAFRARLKRDRYDAVIDLQGLTKSALLARMARGPSYGLANRTDGSGHEWTSRWLVDHAVTVPQRLHALDRARVLVAQVLGITVQGPPQFGLNAAGAPATGPTQPRLMVFVHGSSRDDKLWPESDWIALGRRLLASGWQIALPQVGALELARAERIAAALGPACSVWPATGLDALVDRFSAAQGVIGVDSGLSHIAVALDRPHVQIYNFPTAWRTGPQPAHGHQHQVSVEAAAGSATPTLDAVWQAWQTLWAAAPR